MLALLRENSRARLFFAAHAQSQLGSGAAYVALVLIAYHRLHSAWAISVVLLADFLPGIALASVFGAFADRHSRRALLVAADLLRVVAFLGLALVSSFTATVGFALLAGVGSALFRPAAAAAMPGLTSHEQRPAAVALWGVFYDAGSTLGPALAAIVLLVADAAGVMLFNAVTFAVSAALLARLDLGAGGGGEQRVALSSHLREGLRSARRLPGVMVLLAAVTMTTLMAGMINVAEPLLATGPLHAGATGFALLVACYGVGMVGAAPVVARGSTAVRVLQRTLVASLAGSGVACLAISGAPALGFAFIAFAAAGFANTMVSGYQMRLLQETIPGDLLGRIFGLKETLTNTAFAVAFLLAGGIAAALGARFIFALAGIGVLVVSVCATAGFRAAGGEGVLTDAD